MPNVQAWYHTRMLQTHPKIIQGGMGAGVSSWTLANAVAKTGELGVVSGTALDLILPRRLQVGDPGGHMRRALANFPIPEMAKGILDRYFVEGGKQADEPFKAKPMLVMQPSERLEELLVVSNFVEVYLAKEGHDGVVGINYLEKIQLPNLPSMFGSMLAGVDYILMGAGIPVAIPGILDRLAEGRAVELAVDVKGPSGAERVMNHFDPQRYLESAGVTVERPHFLAIISTPTLATMLVRKADGVVDGFIIEGPTAGGHNAPPRGRLTLSEGGEPIYGSRDEPDLEAMCKIGRPFWLAGSYARPERVVDALADGAAGVQVGTAFAYCEESGLAPELRRQILEMSRQGTAHIFTDPVASPTGFPFKVVEMDGTISSKDVYEARNRVCDLGYLRHAYRAEDGKIGLRCPSEPVEDYLRKGGAIEDTEGRKCVCNGLMANIDLPQARKNGYQELPMVTSGDDVAEVARFLPEGQTEYAAADVVAHLLSLVQAESTATPS